MKAAEYMKEAMNIEDPYNYIVINFASDSIKADAKIIQASYIHKEELHTHYVKGGDPGLNYQFTNISTTVYDNECLSPKVIEDDLVDYIQEENIPYIVYNNQMWNARLIENNEWTRLYQMTNRIPCFAISDYEVVRRAFGTTLHDYCVGKPVPLLAACSDIARRAKNVPKGNRCTVYANSARRGIDNNLDGLVTESERLVTVMNNIMKDILGNSMNEETYEP